MTASSVKKMHSATEQNAKCNKGQKKWKQTRT